MCPDVGPNIAARSEALVADFTAVLAAGYLKIEPNSSYVTSIIIFFYCLGTFG